MRKSLDCDFHGPPQTYLQLKQIGRVSAVNLNQIHMARSKPHVWKRKTGVIVKEKLVDLFGLCELIQLGQLHSSFL